MNRLTLFLIIYNWALLDAVIISWFMIPFFIASLKNIISERYIRVVITFIMISLVMPIVYWIEVPLTIKYCCKKDRPTNQLTHSPTHHMSATLGAWLMGLSESINVGERVERLRECVSVQIGPPIDQGNFYVIRLE